VVVGGCTAEFWALEMTERQQLFEHGVVAVAGRITVIAGTGAIRRQDAITLTKQAQNAGCNGALILLP
jgi:dihydrodipicolinate synthase/N-acetylneuraminate lyase